MHQCCTVCAVSTNAVVFPMDCFVYHLSSWIKRTAPFLLSGEKTNEALKSTRVACPSSTIQWTTIIWLLLSRPHDNNIDSCEQMPYVTPFNPDSLRTAYDQGHQPPKDAGTPSQSSSISIVRSVRGLRACRGCLRCRSGFSTLKVDILHDTVNRPNQRQNYCFCLCRSVPIESSTNERGTYWNWAVPHSWQKTAKRENYYFPLELGPAEIIWN